MSVRGIRIGCDTPGCYAHYQVEALTSDEARQRAADRWGWRQSGLDRDTCAPCQRGDTPDTREEDRP